MQYLALTAIVSIITTGCALDTVEDHYVTLQDARADELFGRGWLPDILPPSARDIHVTNNLDANTSVGDFSFAPTDFHQFAERLTPYANPKHPFAASFDTEIGRHRDGGLPAFQYSQDRSTWIFLCKPARGTCEYTMWLRN